MDIVTYALCKKMASGKGEKGDKGDKGDKGEQGLPGRDGQDGLTPNLQVGDVVTLGAGQQATIVRKGTDENPIFDFSIPKGDDGKDGIFVGKVVDAPDHAQVVVNDDPTPYDLFFENANVDYMGNTYTSLKEKADADIEYLLRKFGTQHYEGVNITATDTYMKRVSSAMFKGQTLVNLFKNYELNYDFSHTNSLSYNVYGFLGKNGLVVNLTTDKTYYIIEKWQITDRTEKTSELNFQAKVTSESSVESYIEYRTPFSIGTHIVKRKLKPSSNFTMYQCGVVNRPSDTIKGKFLGCVIVEYQDGMENWDIPYFEGMQSTKSPVLTVYNTLNLVKGAELSSENSANPSILEVTKTDRGYSVTSNGRNANWVRLDYLFNDLFTKDDIGKSFRFKAKVTQKVNNSGGEIFAYMNGSLDGIKNRDTNKGDVIVIDETFTLKSWNNLVIYIARGNNVPIDVDITDIELFESKFDSIKQHALTTPQDLILRGVGDVHDKLDLVSGQLTEYIGETVLNGSEKWSVWYHTDTLLRFTLNYPNMNNLTNLKLQCDKFPSYGYNAQKEGIFGNNGRLHLIIDNSSNKLPGNTVNDLKAYLSQNPITVCYQLAKPIKKPSIDLKGQKIYSYDDTTHYITKSLDGHPAPILSIDVPTNTTTMIARQREEIQTLSVENEALKEEVVVANQQRKDGDVELLGYNFDLDFRLMEIECSLDLPISLRTKGVKDVNTYKTAKTLILAGNYERADMEHKLAVYLKRGRLTQEEYDELIALMDAREMVE